MLCVSSALLQCWSLLAPCQYVVVVVLFVVVRDIRWACRQSVSSCLWRLHGASDLCQLLTPTSSCPVQTDSKRGLAVLACWRLLCIVIDSSCEAAEAMLLVLQSHRCWERDSRALKV
eukprot:TRINITY_DN49835_c0_g1_i1.p1 TRINITY_DN49835_c0_g1~~TRINITY_DN49835_c0_g1_i1.p1  ORF type:complete len:117 (+),score=3.36 TRINITY_DN49835_c0_g1_i1:57-407(+)